MRVIRRHLSAAAATACVVALAAPVSGASAQVSPFGTGADVPAVGGAVMGQGAPALCSAVGPAGGAPVGGNLNQSCGVALSFIGPSIGQLAAVVGPTIIGSTVAKPVTVSAG